MKNKNKITQSQWNELTGEEKEKLCSWAVNHGYELDMVPGASEDFDPTCQYAALLTVEQMILYLQEHKSKSSSLFNKKEENNPLVLWSEIMKQIKK